MIKLALFEYPRGKLLPGDPSSPTSSAYVVERLEQMGVPFEYRAEPVVGLDLCFPAIFLYTDTSVCLPIEEAIKLIDDSKPRKTCRSGGIIAAQYGLEPLDPYDETHYRFFHRG